MPVFTYQALDRTGSEVGGTIEANDERGALGHIRELGLHPLGVRAGSQAPAAAAAEGSSGTVRRRGRRVRPSDLTIFTRQLANLVGGGLPMMRTLEALLDNTENAGLYEVVKQVKEDVQRGDALYEALGKHPRVFSPLYLSLVAAGEASGQLTGVLRRLADFLEQDLERRAQIRAAMMYPMLLLCVGGLIVVGLVTFLIPKFQVLFQDFGHALPLTTRAVLAVSTFASHWGWAVVLAALGARALHSRWLATPNGRLTWDRWRLSWPLLGRLNHRAATARFARTLGTLLHGGVNILDALQNTEGVMDNAYLVAALRRIRDGVREGGSLGAETRKTGEFPGLLSQMMLVGEETGDVEGALNTVADALDVEVSNALKGLIALVEPVIILVMGGVVALVVFSMLMPIFQMNSVVG